jgi:hypothetical protein
MLFNQQMDCGNIVTGRGLTKKHLALRTLDPVTHCCWLGFGNEGALTVVVCIQKTQSNCVNDAEFLCVFG